MASLQVKVPPVGDRIGPAASNPGNYLLKRTWLFIDLWRQRIVIFIVSTGTRY